MASSLFPGKPKPPLTEEEMMRAGALYDASTPRLLQRDYLGTGLAGRTPLENPVSELSRVINAPRSASRAPDPRLYQAQAGATQHEPLRPAAAGGAGWAATATVLPRLNPALTPARGTAPNMNYRVPAAAPTSVDRVMAAGKPLWEAPAPSPAPASRPLQSAAEKFIRSPHAPVAPATAPTPPPIPGASGALKTAVEKFAPAPPPLPGAASASAAGRFARGAGPALVASLAEQAMRYGARKAGDIADKAGMPATAEKMRFVADKENPVPGFEMPMKVMNATRDAALQMWQNRSDKKPVMDGVGMDYLRALEPDTIKGIRLDVAMLREQLAKLRDRSSTPAAAPEAPTAPAASSAAPINPAQGAAAATFQRLAQEGARLGTQAQADATFQRLAQEGARLGTQAQADATFQRLAQESRPQPFANEVIPNVNPSNSAATAPEPVRLDNNPDYAGAASLDRVPTDTGGMERGLVMDRQGNIFRTEQTAGGLVQTPVRTAGERVFVQTRNDASDQARTVGPNDRAAVTDSEGMAYDGAPRLVTRLMADGRIIQERHTPQGLVMAQLRPPRSAPTASAPTTAPAAPTTAPATAQPPSYPAAPAGGPTGIRVATYDQIARRNAEQHNRNLANMAGMEYRPETPTGVYTNAMTAAGPTSRRAQLRADYADRLARNRMDEARIRTMDTNADARLSAAQTMAGAEEQTRLNAYLDDEVKRQLGSDRDYMNAVANAEKHKDDPDKYAGYVATAQRIMENYRTRARSEWEYERRLREVAARGGTVSDAEKKELRIRLKLDEPQPPTEAAPKAP